MYCLDIRSDKSERINYNKTDFPAYLRLGILSQYPNYAAESHWHDDVEFIVILSGSMDYNINGEIISLKKGEGIFVNARQFHYGFSASHKECIFICILLHPVLLCSSPAVEQKFVLPLITNEAISYHKLSTTTDWEAHILIYLKNMYDSRDNDTAELRILSQAHALWETLYTHMNIEKPGSSPRSHQLTTLKDMISFIQTHYKEKINLIHICQSGNVGKTTCTKIFVKYTNQTPIEYLIDYRLRKSIELMNTTDMTLAEIAYETGFLSAAYYSETFRKHLGQNPNEYRKELLQQKNTPIPLRV